MQNEEIKDKVLADAMAENKAAEESAAVAASEHDEEIAQVNEESDFDSLLRKKKFSLFLKRCFDITASAFGLLVLAVPFLIIAIIIKVTSKGPVFFRQVRVGKNGKEFRIFKFRTMVADAEKKGMQITVGADSRITGIGKFLRKTKVDELPQLINVFIGQMSFVGPRPERKFFIDKIMAINPDYELLYQLRPGLFSPATLYNGYTDTMEKMLERLRMDLEYLHTRSLWLDTKIIYLTVYSIISGKKF